MRSRKMVMKKLNNLEIDFPYQLRELLLSDFMLWQPV